MSKTKQFIGFLIACAVVVTILYSVSELRKYQSANNEWHQVIRSILDMFKTECISENDLDKNNLTDEDELLIIDCVNQKGKEMKDSFKTNNND